MEKDLLKLDLGTNKVSAKITHKTAVRLMFGNNDRLGQIICEEFFKKSLSEENPELKLSILDLVQEENSSCLQMGIRSLLRQGEEKYAPILENYLLKMQNHENLPVTPDKIIDAVFAEMIDNRKIIEFLGKMIPAVQFKDADELVGKILKYLNKVNFENSRLLIKILQDVLEKYPLNKRETLEQLSTINSVTTAES